MSIKEDGLRMLPQDPRQVFLSTSIEKIYSVKNNYLAFIEKNKNSAKNSPSLAGVVLKYYRCLPLLDEYIPLIIEYKKCFSLLSDVKTKHKGLKSRDAIGLFTKNRKQNTENLEAEIIRLDEQLSTFDSKLKIIEMNPRSFELLRQIAYDIGRIQG